MTREQVVRIRELYREAGLTNMQIYCDNGKLFFDGIEGVETIWDDANEIVTCIRKNTDQYHGFKDVSVFTTAYCWIEYITSFATPVKLNTLLDRLVTDTLIDKELKLKILETFK